MKKILFFLTLLPTIMSAQLNNSVSDFSTGYGWGWDLDSKSHISAVETDLHQLLIESNGAKPFGVVSTCELQNRKREFQLETKFQVFRGERFGFALKTDSVIETYFVFSVFEKHVTFSKIVQDKEILILNDVKNKKNYSFFESIKLKVLKSRYKLNFYLNDVLILETPVVTNQSYCHGFLVQGSAKALIQSYNYEYVNEDLGNVPMVENAVQNRLKENLGPNINTKADEFNPLISADGNTLYFTTSDKYNKENNNEDIYLSHYVNKRWEPSLPIANTLNDKYTNGISSIFSNENKMFVKGNYQHHQNIGIGLSLTEKTTNSWSSPKGLAIVGYSSEDLNITNTVSKNGDHLISSLKKSGNFDLFISHKKNDTTYSSPIKLSSLLNTKGDEIYPFLSPDNKKLYFASNGLDGFGASDIWVSERLDESWEKWSEPLNLGPEINTPYPETSFSFSEKSGFAYMASSQKGFGGKDIIRIPYKP